MVVPRALRRILIERLRRLCCFEAGLARALPDAVVRKRFLALDLVFILGIFVSSFEYLFEAAGHARGL